MTRPPPYARHLFDADERIAGDLSCVTCGYNLRSRGLLDICPECGDSVWNTVYAHLVGDTRWLKRVSRGASLLVLAAIALIAPLCACGFDLRVAKPIVAIFLVVSAGTSVFGLLYLTARDPCAGRRSEGISVRRAVRGCLAVSVLLWSAFGVQVVHAPPSGLGASPPLLIISLVVSLLILPGLTLRHLSNLLQRAGSRGTMRAARLLSWVYPACGILLAAAQSVPSAEPIWTAATLAPFALATGGVFFVVLFAKAELAQWLRHASQR